MQRLTLIPKRFFGWTMYPGYAGGPFLSPIQVKTITPLDGRTYDLDFLCIGYAAGVQDMTYRLRTMRRESEFLVAEQLQDDQPTDRIVIIENLTRKWMKRCLPNWPGGPDCFFDAQGQPLENAFFTLMSVAAPQIGLTKSFSASVR